MTWGLVGWCFSRRTHRRGRMITCRARAARCTRKPSPRPLPGWHFPKPASKFSLLTATTHRKRTVNRHSHARHNIQNWQSYGPSYNIHTRKERRNTNANTEIHSADTTHSVTNFFLFYLFLAALSFCLIFVSWINTLSQYRHLYILPHVLYEYIYLYISPLTSVFLAFWTIFFTRLYTIFVFLSISFCLNFA